jgi:hypothetical protein
MSSLGNHPLGPLLPLLGKGGSYSESQLAQRRGGTLMQLASQPAAFLRHSRK